MTNPFFASISPIRRRLIAEDLVRLRRSDEQRRYASSQRQGRVDPNPHQIDAVVFALRRIPEGGCILADEVGLGKTIEAGLIVSQLMAEGWRRVLLVVPKSLLGQWQTELYALFGIEAREGRLDPEAFTGTGVFLVHRELAGGLKGASLLKAGDPFDLIVVDEAHEIFSSIHRRYDKDGVYDQDSKHAQTAGRLRDVIKRSGSPVVLLTATPIQNSLAELWGLVQYVEPTGTLLGRLPTFREIFCDDGGRTVLPDQALELRRRLQTVLQRTLRRQAQEFLQVPFVERRSRVFEDEMSADEQTLYTDVTAWLMREDLFAFRGSQRHLLLISFHRRMASSLAALSASLQRVADRLRDRLARRGYAVSDDGTQLLRQMSTDLEEDESSSDADDEHGAEEASPKSELVSETDEGLRAELEVVESYAARARSLGHDSKARRLLDALRVIQERQSQGTGSGKAVVFTESLTTQDYLRRLLLEHGYGAEDVTLFRGNNEGPDAERALERWEADEGRAIAQAHRPSREVAIRLALVHEFRHRSKVFISTEAGAKGLNLQFCDTVVNCDLPWNPQRIEQRIGRVHRYGQQRGVTVISFLAAGNVAQRLTLEILTQKLDLFGKVLDASDAVLYEPSHAAPESLVASVGVDFEKELRSIYGRARSLDHVTADLQHLRDTMDERRRAFDEVQERASSLIETRLDDAVRQVLASYQSALPSELEGLDRDVDLIVQAYFDGAGIACARAQQPGRVEYRVEPSAALPEGYRNGFVAIVGDSRELGEGEALHVGHALVQAAIEAARRATGTPLSVVFGLPAGAPDDVRQLAGRRGRLVVIRSSYRGIERLDTLLTTAVMEGADDPLEPSAVEVLLALPVQACQATGAAAEAPALQDAIDTTLFTDQAAVSARDQARFDQMLRQLDHYLADQVLILRRKEARLDATLEELQQRRSRTLGVQASADVDEKTRRVLKERDGLLREIAALENGGDEEYREWRDRLFARRYSKPEVARILDVQFEDRGQRPMLKLLHTADLHLGHESAQFEPEDRRRLARARLDAAKAILLAAEQYDVHAVLWAGDLFDTPEPGEDWWRGFASVLSGRANWTRPVILLPGNHDPIRPNSVYHREHPFRRLLPAWVHVVDADTFEFALSPEAVLLAAPCRSMAGAEDLALSLPARPEGDTRIRVGLVHGSTFDLEGYQTRFPIASDAPQQRGLDYLAVGDTHGFRVISGGGVAPIVYPGAPEPTRFGESGTGRVALVSITRAGARPMVTPVPVGRWAWRDEKVDSLETLRRLASEDLSTTALRLRLDLTVSAAEEKAVDDLVRQLRGDLASTGRAGAFILDRSGLRVEVGNPEDVMRDVPETLSMVADALVAKATLDDEAGRALRLLYRLVSEARS